MREESLLFENSHIDVILNAHTNTSNFIVGEESLLFDNSHVAVSLNAHTDTSPDTSTIESNSSHTSFSDEQNHQDSPTSSQEQTHKEPLTMKSFVAICEGLQSSQGTAPDGSSAVPDMPNKAPGPTQEEKVERFWEMFDSKMKRYRNIIDTRRNEIKTTRVSPRKTTMFRMKDFRPSEETAGKQTKDSMKAPGKENGRIEESPRVCHKDSGPAAHNSNQTSVLTMVQMTRLGDWDEDCQDDHVRIGPKRRAAVGSFEAYRKTRRFTGGL